LMIGMALAACKTLERFLSLEAVLRWPASSRHAMPHPIALPLGCNQLLTSCRRAAEETEFLQRLELLKFEAKQKQLERGLTVSPFTPCSSRSRSQRNYDSRNPELETTGFWPGKPQGEYCISSLPLLQPHARASFVRLCNAVLCLRFPAALSLILAA
jgi:hypothetical protein